MRTFLILFITGLLTSCASSKILSDSSYQYSMNAYRTGNVELALTEFPKKEVGGFITTTEKAWLNFWNQKPSVEGLEKQVKSFDERKFTSISREARTFLIQESEEGYVPSEQEVVTLHLVAAMNYLALAKYEDAAVEARRAGFYLENQFNENQKHFDDPALRIWLGTVWASLGDWNNAQADFRKAGTLTNNVDLMKLADGPIPSEIGITFNGTAPELKWTEGNRIPEFLAAENKPKEKSFTFNTDPWFQYHSERNTILRDVVVKSNYMAQYLGVKTTTLTQKSLGRTAAVGMGTLGIIGGGALIAGGLYLASQSPGGSGEALAYIAAAGYGIAKLSYDKANQFDTEVFKEADESEKKRLEDLKIYRVIRFMPQWISVDLKKPVLNRALSTNIPLKSPTSKTQVYFANEF